MTNLEDEHESKSHPFTYIHDTKLPMKFNTTNQPIPTTLSDNEQQLLHEYTNKFSDVSHTTSSLSTSSGSNKVPHDSNYPSFSTGVALPVPSFTTYHDVHVFIQQNIPDMTHLIHSVKLGYFDDGFTKIDTALLLFTHNEQFTNTLLHELENIQPRKFLNNYFYIRNINQGIDLPANFGFYIPNEHEETMAQNFMVRQAKLNCDPCTNSIDRLRSIIITSTNENKFFHEYIKHMQSHAQIGNDNCDANNHYKRDKNWSV